LRHPDPERTVTTDRIAPLLLDWYAAHRRDLPWRRASDPYAVWVSEMMLQQTQVSVVIPYYERWLERFPDVAALAAADEHEVLRLWEGLGYYSRARNLLRGAQAVQAEHGGALPADVQALRALPGIGPYTAGAVASIAFGLDEPLVDGNVIRVLTRLLALGGDPARAPLKNGLWDAARELLPPGRAGDFNQALMELGATVCRKRGPDCGACPLRGECRAFAAGEPERYPETAPRRAVTKVDHVAAWIERDGRVLVVRRASDADRWPGLWTLPEAVRGEDEPPESAAERAAREIGGLEGSDDGSLHVHVHGITRWRIRLELRRVRAVVSAEPAAGARWASPAELARLALPAPHRRLVEFMAAGG
jgi:A/G-specific adenine glycosylase